ncbi:hypothetical protein RKD48_004819 [Streptomyces ambofaciens]
MNATSRSAVFAGVSTRPALVSSAVERATSWETARRSESYESRIGSPNSPRTTPDSFHARLNASCMPVFMPCPPAGLITWAASPARKQRPLRNAEAILTRTLKEPLHSSSSTRLRPAARSSTTCWNIARGGGWSSSYASCGTLSAMRWTPSPIGPSTMAPLGA